MDGEIELKSYFLNRKVDMVEVVRCKDCRKRHTPMCMMYFSRSKPGDKWYCADGERKDGDGE